MLSFFGVWNGGKILDFINAVYSMSDVGFTFWALLGPLGCYRSSMFSMAAFISGHLEL
jgi:hypothetical protein